MRLKGPPGGPVEPKPLAATPGESSSRFLTFDGRSGAPSGAEPTDVEVFAAADLRLFRCLRPAEAASMSRSPELDSRRVQRATLDVHRMCANGDFSSLHSQRVITLHKCLHLVVVNVKSRSIISS